MLFEDYFLIGMGCVLVAVGLAITLARRGIILGEEISKSTRMFGVFFTLFALCFLAIMIWRLSARSGHIKDLRSLNPDRVTMIHLGIHEITDAEDIRRIVRCLNDVEPYPAWRAIADNVLVEIAVEDGRRLRFTVARSLDAPGAVVGFCSGDSPETALHYGCARGTKELRAILTRLLPDGQWPTPGEP